MCCVKVDCTRYQIDTLASAGVHGFHLSSQEQSFFYLYYIYKKLKWLKAEFLATYFSMTNISRQLEGNRGDMVM